MLENRSEIKKITSSMIRYLEQEQNFALAELLKNSYPSSEEIAYDNWNGGTYVYQIIYEIDVESFHSNRALIDEYQKELLEVAELFVWRSGNEQLDSVIIRPICRQYIDWNQGISKEQLTSAIEQIKSKMIAVATGGPQINSVNKSYKELYATLDAWINKLGLENPNPFRDLWDWYGRWQQADLSSYAARRAFIQELYQDCLDTVEKSVAELTSGEYTPTGWDRVDRAVYEMKRRLSVANTEEQFQAIGMLGRETLITIAQQVFDINIHKTEDGTLPSETDAKRMLDAYLAYSLPGVSNERQRKFAKASVDLANQLTHDRMAERSDAEICLTAVTAVANLIHILDKRAPQ